jgi:hypothetical protein
VVRAIGNDLHMDYTAVGQTTHLAARMEQLAHPGSTLLTADTLRLVEGLVQVAALGPIPVKGLPAPVEVFELIGASALRCRFQAAAARGLTLLDEAEARARVIGDRARLVGVLAEMAAVLRVTGDFDGAITAGQQALALAKELGMRPLVAHCHHGRGQLYSQTGQRQRARTELSTAITMYRTMGMTFWLPQAEAALAQMG